MLISAGALVTGAATGEAVTGAAVEPFVPITVGAGVAMLVGPMVGMTDRLGSVGCGVPAAMGDGVINSADDVSADPLTHFTSSIVENSSPRRSAIILSKAHNRAVGLLVGRGVDASVPTVDIVLPVGSKDGTVLGTPLEVPAIVGEARKLVGADEGDELMVDPLIGMLNDVPC